MRIGVTEIKRPASDSKETEPLVKESTGASLSKKTISRKGKAKKVHT
jgi:hypothetical protein